MAISRIGTPGTGTTSCTFPTHQAGDLLIVFAFRDGSTASPSLPATWWNYFSETGANTCSIRVGYKIATGAGTASGTWTNATSVIGVVYRGATLGALIQGRGSSTTFSYNAISTMAFNNTTSWVGAFVASRDGTNTSVPNIQIAPTGMTNVVSVKDATDAAGFHDTNGTVSSWSTQTQATGVAATGWYTLVFELVATQTNKLGFDVIGASTNTLTDYFVGASFDCTDAFTANVGKWYGNQNSGSGTYDFAIYEETSLNNYTFLSQATGTITVGTTPAWNQFTINQALTVGKRYFIAFWSTSAFTFYFNSGMRVGVTYATTGNTFNTWPSPELGGITDTAFISIYMENASSVAAAPPVGPLVMTGYGPTASVTNNISAAPPTGPLALAGFAPVAFASNNIIASPLASNLVMDGHAPSAQVTNNVSASPDTSNLVLNGFAPVATVTNNVFASPNTGNVVMNGFAPVASITNHISASPDTGQLIMNGYAPNAVVTNNVSASPATGDLVMEGFAPTIEIGNNKNAQPPTGTLVLNSFAPIASVSNNVSSNPGTADIILEGYAPVVTISNNVSANPLTGELVLNGFAPTVSISNNIIASPTTGEMTLSGYAPMAFASDNKVASPATGNLQLDGYAPSIYIAPVMVKPAYAINFTFVKQSHVVNYTSTQEQHSINYTFVKINNIVDSD